MGKRTGMNEQMENTQTQVTKKPSGSGCLKAGLIGCGSMFLLVVVLGVYAVVNRGPLSVSIGHWVATRLVNNSELPEADKKEIVKELDNLKKRYDSEEIDGEDILNVFKELAESPIMGLGIVIFADESYIKPSGLSEDEKVEARLTVNRFARGFAEKKISNEAMQETTKSIYGDDTGFRDTLSDDELRTFLAAMKNAADEAEIPMEDYVVDIAEEFRKVVKAALGD